MRHRTLPALVVGTILALGFLASGLSADTASPPADGERFLFSARWNGIPVARAELVITPEHGTPQRTVHLRGKARTNAFLDLFWRMRNSFDATVPIDPTTPGRFYLAQNENSRRRQTWIERDDAHARLIGRLERPGRKTRHGEAELHSTLHDPASIAYLVKHLPGDFDTPRTYEVFEGWKVYTMKVTPEGEEDIYLMGRRWRARKLRLGLALVPRTEVQRRKNKQPKIQHAELWISADDERVLLRMVAGTWWGRVTIAITGREPAGVPAPALLHAPGRAARAVLEDDAARL